MIEHRLIERVIADVQTRLDGQGARRVVDTAYVDRVVDFLRTYADRCHHGKEEDILFRDLRQKTLEPGHKTLMFQLVEDHEWARATTRRLVAANASVAVGNKDSLQEARRLLHDLASFYPVHIEKEDKTFFRLSMAYLTPEEQEAMLREFTQFDASLIHEKYRRAVVDLEADL